jgi:hypothetical protein
MFSICKREVNMGPLVLRPQRNQKHDLWNDNRQGKAEVREQKPVPLLLRASEILLTLNLMFSDRAL